MEKVTKSQLEIMYAKFKAGEMSKSKWQRICIIATLQAIGVEND
jgi:hypothetical protein